MTRKILLIGAGRSATILIRYLLGVCEKEGWHLIVADTNKQLAERKINGHSCGEALEMDATDAAALSSIVSDCELAISMLPANMHVPVAQVCLKAHTHLITASYVSPEMRALHSDAEREGLLFLNECGLDPGIDHMSAMKVLDDIRDEGGEIRAFESFTGGLLAPNNDDNPWQYKFTWNPRNVVLAGQGIVKFVQEGRYKYIPYGKLFRRTEMIHIPEFGYFEGYANRDSLKYREMYGLENVKTMFRGTLRRPGFCKAWDIFVQLGATDDSYLMEGVPSMSHRQFINSFLSFNPDDSIELKLAHYLNLDMEGEEMHKMKWLGMFSDELIGLDQGTPAQILEHILKKKWTMQEDEGDMIVMWHKFNYFLNGEAKEKHATLVMIGENQQNTAMAKTVGLPLGIAAKLTMQGKLTLNGVHTPTHKEIYNPILDELVTQHSCHFVEQDHKERS